jgi:hypothetical protein
MQWKEALKVIRKAKNLGVKEISMEGLSVKFREENVPRETIEYPKKSDLIESEPMKMQDDFKPISPLSDLTPEEILYYATPHYDEIQAEKELKASSPQGETHVDN